MAHGHRHPQHYPLSKLWFEAELVKERVNQHSATEASIMQTVIASVLTADGSKNLKKLLRRLTHG